MEDYSKLSLSMAAKANARTLTVLADCLEFSRLVYSNNLTIHDRKLMASALYKRVMEEIKQLKTP